MDPRVSIILAVRDDARRLVRSVESIVRQSVRDWELIIVDDGSSDASASVGKAFAAADSRIRVVPRGPAGIAPARNDGMALARGEWIAVADSDDFWHPRKLERQLAFLERHPPIGVLGTRGYRISATGRRLGHFDLGPESLADFRSHRASATPFGLIHASVVFRRALFVAYGGYPTDYPLGIDLAYFNLRLAPHTQILVMRDRLVSNEIRPDSIQRRRVNHALDVYQSVALNLQRQRLGLPELSYFDAVEALSRGSAWTQLVRQRMRERHRRYTLGASALAAGSLRGLGQLAMAFLIAPLYTTRRAASQLRALELGSRLALPLDRGQFPAPSTS